VCDEIFDMVKPKNGGRITFDDLTNSGVAETVMRLVGDLERKHRLSLDGRFRCLTNSGVAETVMRLSHRWRHRWTCRPLGCVCVCVCV
jgi:hypothetical protein